MLLFEIQYTSFVFFFNDTATTEIYTLSLHDALPIFVSNIGEMLELATNGYLRANVHRVLVPRAGVQRYSIAYFLAPRQEVGDRKSTRLNSSHSQISYAVFCLKKKTTIDRICAFGTHI